MNKFITFKVFTKTDDLYFKGFSSVATGILLDSTYHTPNNSKVTQKIPLLNIKEGDEASPRVKKELTQICSSYLGSEDFSIWSLLEEKNHEALVQKSVAISVFAVALMIGLIGIFNAFSTISNNLRLRKREFAMLIIVSILLSYGVSSTCVKKSNVVESIKNEIV